MGFFLKFKEILENNTFTVFIASAISVFGIGFKVANTLDENKYEYKIQEYQAVIASINRRIGGKAGIDISKLKIHKDSTSILPKNTEFFPGDNFYATKDSYWKYKLTSPIELSYIKNGVDVPSNLRNNPVDMPIHLWIGQGQFKITESGWQKQIKPYSLLSEAERKNLSSNDPEPIIYPTDQIIFNPIVTLHKWQRDGNSFKFNTEKLDSVVASVGFEKLAQNEVIGKFIADDISEYFYDFPDPKIKREILLMQKNSNVLYASYLTTYNDISINNVKQKSFFVYKELIVICTDKDLYEIDLQIPSLEPRKVGSSFEKIAEWYNAFGIVVD